MSLRTRLLLLSVSTVALIVTALFALQLNSLTKTWLDYAGERSAMAGRFIQSLIFLQVADSTSGQRPASLAETKRIWNQTVAGDKDLADKLVEQAAMPNSSIVEINVVGEDGRVIVSSVPSRDGQPAPQRESLAALEDSGFFGRLSAITTSTTDYETRIPLGISDQPRPVFEIQLLVSTILLQDKLHGDLVQTAMVSLLALLAAVALAGASTHFALKPVKRISKAIDTLSMGRPLGLFLPEESREDREIAAVEYKLSLLGEKMQDARRDAESAIGSLARGVAHEIKNPLNAISLRLETLRMRIAGEVPEAEADIDLVSNEVHRLDRVVRTFLDLNRPMELEIVEFDPAQLAATVIEIMRPAATQAGVELQLAAPSGPFTVQADRGLIEQGMLNVVNNAIQALTSCTGGRVRTSVSRTGENCTIAVNDNGPGMPRDLQDRIFEPYFTTKSGGSGIGLAVTKRAMELHGGAISVESSPGHGTTMAMTFPLAGAAVRSHA